MKTIPWGNVKVPSDRQRQDFNLEKIEDLATSIDELGIIHPPALRIQGDQLVLVAGERRWRAMGALLEMGKQIRHGSSFAPVGEIPYLDLGTMTDMAAFESELAENIARENLTWQERARAESKLHDLRTQQKQAAGLPPQTLVATATEIAQRKNPDAPAAVGSAITEVATRVQLAKYLDDPDVAAAKSPKDAAKIVRQKQQAKQNAIAAAAFDEVAARTVPHKLLVGPMEVHLAGMEDESQDILLTDPPYGIDAQSFGEQSGQGHNYNDTEEYFHQLISVLADESYRICKAQAHAYVFCDPRRFDALKLQFELAGWDVWYAPLIWAKGNGMLPRPDHAPRRTYECIMFASKGGKPVTCVKGDVINVPAVRQLQHGAQKPVGLYVDLLSRSARPGDAVFDPFAGSGTIFPASNQCKVVATAIELEPANADICKIRITESGDDDSLIPNL
jgi:ParB-like chromosome segregation protein Spo0J